MAQGFMAVSATGRPNPVLERLRRRVLGPLFDRLGYDLVPATPDWMHRPVSEREIATILSGAARALAADFAAAGLPGAADLDGIVRDFWNLICSAPVRQRRGGNGFNGALQLYAVVRALQPTVIIESGVFRGLTTWVMRQACPEARLFCFDPDLSGLRYRDPRAHYSARDWSAHDFAGVDLSGAVAFFDDHISQARRIVEAHERGITRVLLDDDAAAHRLHAHGGPAFPTLSMVLADPGSEPVRWRRNGREFAYAPDPLAAAARACIRSAHVFDDLHRETGYSPARLSTVTLRTPSGTIP